MIIIIIIMIIIIIRVRKHHFFFFAKTTKVKELRCKTAVRKEKEKHQIMDCEVSKPRRNEKEGRKKTLANSLNKHENKCKRKIILLALASCAS